jgi:uncharacterized protein (TIGR01244 family)
VGIESSYNFRRVDDAVTTSGVVSVDQLGELRREGYEAVINLLPDGDHSVPDEARIVEDQGIDYVHIPVDFAAPSRADLDAFTETMDAHAARKVHVHCAANYRATAFYALYGVRRGLCTAEEADQLVRSVWDPAEFPAWQEWMSEEQARETP